MDVFVKYAETNTMPVKDRLVLTEKMLTKISKQLPELLAKPIVLKLKPFKSFIFTVRRPIKSKNKKNNVTIYAKNERDNLVGYVKMFGYEEFYTVEELRY